MYAFSNVNGAAVEVLEWLSNLMPHFTDDLSMLGFKLIHISKKTLVWTKLFVNFLFPRHEKRDLYTLTIGRSR